MKFRPLHDRVLVKRVEPETTTTSGLILPDTTKEKPTEGEVVAVGNGKRLDDGSVRALSVKAGDRVIFGKYTGDEVKLDGVEHIILSESDLLAVVERA